MQIYLLVPNERHFETFNHKMGFLSYEKLHEGTDLEMNQIDRQYAGHNGMQD